MAKFSLKLLEDIRVYNSIHMSLFNVITFKVFIYTYGFTMGLLLICWLFLRTETRRKALIYYLSGLIYFLFRFTTEFYSSILFLICDLALIVLVLLLVKTAGLDIRDKIFRR